MATVTKKELAYRIAEATGQKKVAIKKLLQSFLQEVIVELARGNRLEFRDFGVFEVRARASRKARNPRTNAKIVVPERAIVHFKPGRLLRDLSPPGGPSGKAAGMYRRSGTGRDGGGMQAADAPAR